MAVLTIRDVPEDVKEALARDAREHGQSLQSFLLGVLKRQAAFSRNRRLRSETERDLAEDGGAGADAPDAAELLEQARPDVTGSHSHRHEDGWRSVIVVDASVLANMLLYADERGRRARAVLGRGRDTEWAAPEHWKAEVFSVVCGLTLGSKIKEEQAARAVDRPPLLGVDHVCLDELLPRMWQLRAGIRGYDAAYVALAEARAIPLVTSDGRLARAATSYCRGELVS